MTEPLMDLTTLPGLTQALRAVKDPMGGIFHGRAVNGTICVGCGAMRRMALSALHWRRQRYWDGARELSVDDAPALFTASCVRCDSAVSIVLHQGPNGLEVVALPRTYGGLSTPHCPPAVAYYLDQAQRAQSVGALSAAVAMYRAALEQLLFEQGYMMRNLKPKIDALVKDAKPPRWFEDLDPDFLEAIKDLGNAAIHPNDGDVSAQDAFKDRALLGAVQALFAELLDDIYEQPHLKAERKSVFTGARAVFKHDASGRKETSVPDPETR